MSREEVRVAGERLVEQAGRVRAAFPDANALLAVPIDPPIVGKLADAAAEAVRAALGFLRAEILLVQAGKTADLGVLADEMANSTALLSRL